MRNKISNILWGLLLIALGVAFAGSVVGLWHFTIFFRGWWTLFIIVPCLINMIRRGIHIANTIGLLVGVMLLLAAQGVLSGLMIGKLIFPLILVIIGFGIIFRDLFGRRIKRIEGLNSGAEMDYTAIFSAQKVQFPPQPFEGANITAIFGGVDLDLRGAVISHDIVINATSVFGGSDIFVPSNVKVVVSSLPIFGGVSNKSINSKDADAPTVYVKATCIVGGVDIK